MSLTAHGNITQAGVITANAGTTTLTETLAGSDILLNTQANDFGTSAIVFGGTQSNIRDFALRNINSGAITPVLSGLTSLRNLTLSYDAAPIVAPTVTLSGNMNLTAHGNISETGVITANAGTTTLTETLAASDILLSSQANDFGTSAIVFGGTESNIRDFDLRNINSGATTPVLSGLTSLRNLILSYDAAPIVVPTVTLSGNMSLTAHGNITQSGVITANAGTTTLSETLAASDILLNTQANDFGATALVFSGTQSNIRDVAIRNINSAAATPSFTGLTNLRNLTLQFDNAGITFSAVTLTNSGILSATAGGVITQTGAITVPGTASFTAGGNAITLTQGNSFTGAITLSNSGTNNVILENSIATILAASTVGQNLTVTSSGAITQTGALTVPGASSFSASTNPITLTQSNNFTGAVSLSNSSTNNVSVTNSGALVIGASSIGQNLSLIAGGTISENGVITATGGTTTVAVTAPTSDILLGSQANNFGTSALVFGGTQANIRDVSLRNINAGAVLPSFTGLTNLRNLTLEFDNAAIAFPAVTLTNSGNLSAIAGGAITQTGAITVPGTSSFTAGGNAITLTQTNSLTGAITFSNSGTNNVSLTNSIATVLAASTVGQNLNVTSSGAITQTGALTVPGASSFSASTNPITLTQSNNFTGAVSLSNSSTNNVSVTNTGALVIGTSSIGQNLSLIAGGTISESGVITATGGTTTVSVTAPTSDILLGTQANNFGTSALVFGGTQADIRDVSLRNTNAGAVLPSFTGLTNLRNLTLEFDNAAIAFPAITLTSGGSISAIADGAITQTGALTVPGTSSFTAGGNVITLTQANSLTGAITLSNSGTNNVSLTNSIATVLAASTVGQNLTVTSSGAITQTGH